MKTCIKPLLWMTIAIIASTTSSHAQIFYQENPTVMNLYHQLDSMFPKRYQTNRWLTGAQYWVNHWYESEEEYRKFKPEIDAMFQQLDGMRTFHKYTETTDSQLPGSSALQTVPPMLSKRIRRTRQIAVRWIAAASVAAACFFLGTTVSRKEAAQPTNSIPMPPTVLTEVKWKTDTVFIEKPVPTALTAKIITVRDTIVLPASHPKGQMWAALSTGQDTSSTKTASIPPSDTTLQDADTAARQQTMPHLADIQAEFQKQKRRMDEFSKQYEINIPPYENVY